MGNTKLDILQHQFGHGRLHRSGESMESMKGKFKNYLDVCLERANVTAPELARKVPTSPQNINRLVNWQRKLTTEWAQRLAPHLPGIEPDDLVFGPDRRSRPSLNEDVVPQEREGSIGSGEDDAWIGTIDPDDLLPLIREMVGIALDMVGYDSLKKTSKSLIIREVLEAQLGRQVRFLPLRSARREKRPSTQARLSARRASDEKDLLP